ncbi:MAG: DUF192 domain-containing protein [Litoreibacter sp.]|nr:DUF192 domain-containing protein [Boseongicola sp.]NNK79836.1 DUF192 domain-containing protein [Litoreibacter sp.]
MRCPIIKTAFSLLIWASTSVGAFSMCKQDIVSVRGDWGQAEFRVEVADDATERSRGLMFRESLPRMSGMLFIYERPQSMSFWMRNTLIPLDMIFVDPEGRVRAIHENAVPLDETPIRGGPGLLGVLEINGGLSRKLGIGVGSELRHPGLPQKEAAWPCAAN